MSQPIDAYFMYVDNFIQCAAEGKTPFTVEQLLTTTSFAIQQTGFLKGIKGMEGKTSSKKNMRELQNILCG
eukprot:7196839-Ditylum_brightwellii.AAC.1